MNFIFVVTDGLEDVLETCAGWGHRAKAVSSSSCDPIKQTGATVICATYTARCG